MDDSPVTPPPILHYERVTPLAGLPPGCVGWKVWWQAVYFRFGEFLPETVKRGQISFGSCDEHGIYDPNGNYLGWTEL